MHRQPSFILKKSFFSRDKPWIDLNNDTIVSFTAELNSVCIIDSVIFLFFAVSVFYTSVTLYQYNVSWIMTMYCVYFTQNENYCVQKKIQIYEF